MFHGLSGMYEYRSLCGGDRFSVVNTEVLSLPVRSSMTSITNGNDIGEVTQRRARLDWDGWPCSGSVSSAGHLSLYVSSHPGQLSLAILSCVVTVSTRQRAVTPWGWGVKAGIVRVWVTGNTVIPLLHTGHIWAL